VTTAPRAKFAWVGQSPWIGAHTAGRPGGGRGSHLRVVSDAGLASLADNRQISSIYVPLERLGLIPQSGPWAFSRRTSFLAADRPGPLRRRQRVLVPAGRSVTSLPNKVNVQGGEGEGGGAVPTVSLTRPVTVSGAPTPFGVEEGGYTLTPENEGGSLDSKAGSHPFQLTSTTRAPKWGKGALRKN
jgi:hypothetical protein